MNKEATTMSQESKRTIFYLFIAVTIIAMVSFLAGWDIGSKYNSKKLRLEATEAGAAEFRTNKQTGETTFHWLGAEK